MSTLQEIRRHIASMDELSDVVGAMRALAVMRLQEAQQALPGVRRYAQAMAGAIHSAWRIGVDDLPLDVAPAADSGRRRLQRAVIVCAAEHGFVGSFNERLLEVATTQLSGDDELYVLGSRASALALERGQRIKWMHPMATRLASVPEIVNRLSDKLFAGIGGGRLRGVEVCFASARSGGGCVIQHRTLLPLDIASLGSAPPAQSPLHNLPSAQLLEGLVAEYVFALLTESAVESLASENAARFAAMDSARDNVARKLQDLRQSANQLRQEEITAELLDLITGTLASGR